MSDMTTGQRMKQRRKELGISAEKVAEELNVSPATIYRYENGDIDKVPGDKLEPIANALHTTPAYLMGWEKEKTAPKGNDLSDEELALLDQFRNATPEKRAAIMALLK